MPVGDFDYRVMLWIRESEHATMDLLTDKFGSPVRSTVESLCKDKFLYWDRPVENLWGHDDAESKIELTPAGERELNNFVESERLTAKAKWRERLWAVVVTLFIESVLWFFTHLDTIGSFFQSLRTAAGK